MEMYQKNADEKHHPDGRHDGKGVLVGKLRRKKFLLENWRMDGEFHGQGDKRTSLGGVYVVLMTNPD